MMRKLLKYDLKSGIRIFGYVWLGIAALTGLVCLLLAIGLENNTVAAAVGGLSMIPLVFGIMGAVVYSNIFVALRFYNGLLGREGYLMFTLPTEPWKLLVSKLVSAIIFTCGTAVLSLGGLFSIMAVAVDGFRLSDIEFLLEALGGDLSFGWSMIITILGYLVSTTASVLQIYLACCLGHLCKGKRGLLSVLFYFGINMAVSTLSTAIQTAFVIGNPESLGVLATGALYFTIPFNLGLALLFFFLSEWILRTKLNLE